MLIANLVIGMSANTGKLSADMRKSMGIINKFETGIRSLGRRLAGLGALLTGGGLLFMVKQQLKAVDVTAKLSRQLGVSTEALQQLRHAAELTGAGAKSLDAGLGTMAKRLGEVARAGSGAAAPALVDLGLSARDLIQMAPDKAFIEIAAAMEGIVEPAKRNAIAANLFSKANQGLLNTLSLGRGGLEAAAAQADALGISFSAAAAGGVEDANDALTRSKAALSAMGQSITITLAPIIEKIANKFTVWAKILQNVSTETWESWGRMLKYTAALAAGVFIVAKIVKAIKAMVFIYKSLAKAQVVALAFSGPKGWAAIAAGAAVAAGAMVVVNNVTEGFSEAAEKAAADADVLANSTMKIGDSSGDAADAVQELTGSMEKQNNTALNIINGLRKTRDEFGQTARQIDINNALFNEGTLEQIEMINALHDQVDALKLAEEQMKKNAERIKEQAEEAKQFASAFRGLAGPSGQLTAGGALTVVHQIQRSTMPVPRGRDTGKQTVDELQTQTRLLRDIDRQIAMRPQVAAL